MGHDIGMVQKDMAGIGGAFGFGFLAEEGNEHLLKIYKIYSKALKLRLSSKICSNQCAYMMPLLPNKHLEPLLAVIINKFVHK